MLKLKQLLREIEDNFEDDNIAGDHGMGESSGYTGGEDVIASDVDDDIFNGISNESMEDPQQLNPATMTMERSDEDLNRDQIIFNAFQRIKNDPTAKQYIQQIHDEGNAMNNPHVRNYFKELIKLGIRSLSPQEKEMVSPILTKFSNWKYYKVI